MIKKVNSPRRSSLELAELHFHNFCNCPACARSPFRDLLLLLLTNLCCYKESGTWDAVLLSLLLLSLILSVCHWHDSIFTLYFLMSIHSYDNTRDENSSSHRCCVCVHTHTAIVVITPLLLSYPSNLGLDVVMMMMLSSSSSHILFHFYSSDFFVWVRVRRRWCGIRCIPFIVSLVLHDHHQHAYAHRCACVCHHHHACWLSMMSRRAHHCHVNMYVNDDDDDGWYA